VIQDLLYKGQTFKNYTPANAEDYGYPKGQDLKTTILSPDFRIGFKTISDYGYEDPRQIQWKLTVLPKVTIETFTDNTQKKIGVRQANQASYNHLPNNDKRHEIQAKKIEEEGPSQEPLIGVLMKDGKIELLEGWHRTLEALKAFPDGYNARAYLFQSKSL
jgi:hypothetical protein